MCKWIKDILFPTNVLGKKKKAITLPVPDDHSWVILNIVWSGERLDVAWTTTYKAGGRPAYNQRREQYTNGDSSAELIEIRRTVKPLVGIVDNAIYFNCTNVTYLEINGEQYI